MMLGQDVIGKRKPKYLVKWKEYTVNKDICKELINLENIKELVKKFKKEIGRVKESTIEKVKTVKSRSRSTQKE